VAGPVARRFTALSLLALVVTAAASGAGGANGAGEFTFYPRRGSSGAPLPEQLRRPRSRPRVARLRVRDADVRRPHGNRLRQPQLPRDGGSDFDIVRYRYRWFVDGKLVRAVQSAALTDVLRRGLARPGRSVPCAVTPSDGRLSGPTATAR